jgi:hypothetical protein
MITHRKAGHTRADFNNNACAFMAQNRRENTFGVITGTGEFIRMTQACGLDFNQNLARARAFKVHFHYFKWFASSNCNGGTGAHHFIGPPDISPKVCDLRRIFKRQIHIKDSNAHFATLPNPSLTAQKQGMKKLLMLLALAACATVPVPPSATIPIGNTLPQGMDDTCGAVRYHTLLTRDATALEKVLIMGQVRILRPSAIVTQDYRPDRMNFHIDASNRISRISCG